MYRRSSGLWSNPLSSPSWRRRSPVPARRRGPGILSMVWRRVPLTPVVERLSQGLGWPRHLPSLALEWVAVLPEDDDLGMMAQAVGHGTHRHRIAEDLRPRPSSAAEPGAAWAARRRTREREGGSSRPDPVSSPRLRPRLPPRLLSRNRCRHAPSSKRRQPAWPRCVRAPPPPQTPAAHPRCRRHAHAGVISIRAERPCPGGAWWVARLPPPLTTEAR